jgi:hypothetical protein
VSPSSAEELQSFFSVKAGPGKLSLNDERYIYRNLPLSMQIQVHCFRSRMIRTESENAQTVVEILTELKRRDAWT